uniref:Ankyrin repeat and SOCS box containing 10 n=1 Tax=Ficedula albicollis TaxID=59894 RepID=A0A803W5Y0_FICAL
MDCTFPLRSATQRSLQPARWKNAHGVGSHHSEHSLSPGGSGHQHSRLEPLECRDLLVQNALFTGDLDMVQKYFTKGSAINLIIETRGDVLRWTSSKRGLWSLSYEQELTTPLHITASRGHTGCLRLLLQRGAAPDLAPGGRTALHHVQLLLHHGAELEVKNKEGQTPLNAACAQHHQPQDMDRYYRVCQLLVESGASINAADREQQRPLHLACKNANAQIAELLLARGANVNVMNYGGSTALHNILQVAAYKLEHHPELVVRALAHPPAPAVPARHQQTEG